MAKEGINIADIHSMSKDERLKYLVQSRLLRVSWFKHLADKRLGKTIKDKRGVLSQEELQATAASMVCAQALENLLAQGQISQRMHALLAASLNKWMGDEYRRMQRVAH